MDLTKFMLNTPAGRTKKEDRTVTRQVATGLSSYIKSGLRGTETPEEKQVRLAIEKSNAFQKAFAKTEADRDSLFAIGDNDFQLIPMFEADTSGNQKFVFKDQTLSIPGYLTTVAANCAASYAASKALFGQKMDSKASGIGVNNDWAESVASNGAGFIASYVTGALATVGDNYLESKIQGIFTLPKESDLAELKTKNGVEHYVVKAGAQEAIMNKIKETKEYKDSKLGTAKAINLGLSILNGAALGYHGFKRYEKKSTQEQYLMSAGFALGGIFGLTNLGYAFAQGFAQPCCDDNSVDFIAGPTEMITVEEVSERNNPRKRGSKARKHSKSKAKASKAGKKKSGYKRRSR